MTPDGWRNRNVLITGCTGFLGSWLTLALVRLGARVLGMAHQVNPASHFALLGLQREISLELGSVTDRNLVDRILRNDEIEICFHLAAQAIVTTANASPVSTFESNIQGTWVVLEAARQSETLERVIVASSDKAYGDYPAEQLPLTEQHPLRAQYPYDASKACADLLAQTYSRTYPTRESGGPLRVGITRCANIYGGGDLNLSPLSGLGRIVPDVVCAALQNRRPILRSHGQHMRDFLFVLDAVSAYLELAEQLGRAEVHGQAFNFSMEQPERIVDLTRQILATADQPDMDPDIRGKAPASGEILVQYLNCSKARQTLGWKCRWTLAEGLKETVRWYRQWLTDPPPAAALSRDLVNAFVDRLRR